MVQCFFTKSKMRAERLEREKKRVRKYPRLFFFWVKNSFIKSDFRLESKKRKSLETTGRTLVALDTLGAGQNEFVLITQGSSARLTPETKDKPIDAVIVGIVDQVHVEQLCVYTKED